MYNAIQFQNTDGEERKLPNTGLLVNCDRYYHVPFECPCLEKALSHSHMYKRLRQREEREGRRRNATFSKTQIIATRI